LPGVLCRLTLRVVEVGGNGDDRLVNLVAQVRLRRFFQLAENLARDFLGRELLLAGLDFDVVAGAADDLVGDHLLFRLDFMVPSPHETLDGIDRTGGVGDGLAFGGFANEDFSLVRERHDARGEAVSFRISDNLRLASLHHGNHAVRGPQVDPDNLFSSSHVSVLRLVVLWCVI
jgi:hypothetical protein